MKKQSYNVNKSNVLIISVIVLIVLFVVIQFYKVTHIELKTQTATISTVYDKVSSEALFIRDESVVEKSPSGVTVACFQDGDKINVNGNVAMQFSSSKAAANYSKYAELTKQIKYYQTLEAQTVGQSADLETINEDIEQKVINYADGLAKNRIGDTAEDLDSVLVRRQLIIGEDVNLLSIIENLRDQRNNYQSYSKPDRYIKTDKSGVFSSYTDGYENLIDYSKVEETTIDGFKSALKAVDKAQNVSNNIGKLVTSYTWYVQTLVSADTVKNLENGDYVNIVLKDDTSKSFKAEIVNGAEIALGQKETLLVLKLNEMDADIAKLRKAEIEIRRNTYEGIKVPSEALHVLDGKKGVYVLIASQVKFREVNVIYSDDDYVLAEYDESNEKSIHLYDKIITQGKDLKDGKVYT
ncbi:HlyD family efflux transporter periplasmic adaptor subunit [Eubacterium coprostanoligenes]|uniref:Putative membrane fusion protein n=1 Tax=Eubacterium coprostanoligenes TaxID=290054 RepID=A0A1T4K2U4_9FIRM|nr:HlyD family efflux transporter periplasmic adaptor subunit [Eubacterium coprostanoligenes]MDY4698579.1 HlyD family efflux transporter periplasmic adaptor subunit [Eubacterium coprostanoligenes]SJZ36645.1 putative membrane fusion protein [Eubacterium coprostanoligenes]